VTRDLDFLLRGMLLLSAAVDRLRARFDSRGLAWVNRVSGTVITAFGVVALVSVLRGAG